MKRRVPVFIVLLLVFAALPAAAQKGPLSMGPVVGVVPAGDYFLMPIGVDLRYTILDWLSLRADLCYAPLVPSVQGYPVIAVGAEMGSAGFYGKVIGETLLAIAESQLFIPIVTAGMGFSIVGFFIEIDFNVLFAYGAIAPSLGSTLGYRFAL